MKGTTLKIIDIILKGILDHTVQLFPLGWAQGERQVTADGVCLLTPFYELEVFIQYVSGDSFVPAHAEWLGSQKFAEQILSLLFLFAVQFSHLLWSI